MGNLGFTEIMVILLVVLLLFGAKRLPEVGASIGKGIREFRKASNDLEDSVRGDTKRAASDDRPSTDTSNHH